mgnify:CR=1 FL=1
MSSLDITRTTPRIKLRGNGHPAIQKNKSFPAVVATKQKFARPILRVGNKLVKGTAPLPGCGAPKGSQNSRNGRLVKEAIIRALRKRSRSDMLEELDLIALAVIQRARKGDISAVRELWDRIDGKPAQMLIGDPENPLQFNDQTQLTNPARVTRLLQILALERPMDNGRVVFTALKARPKLGEKK